MKKTFSLIAQGLAALGIVLLLLSFLILVLLTAYFIGHAGENGWDLSSDGEDALASLLIAGVPAMVGWLLIWTSKRFDPDTGPTAQDAIVPEGQSRPEGS